MKSPVAIPMSFLFVDTERVWRGGQDQLFSLLRGLLQRGHAVHLVCHPGTLLEERSREANVHVYPISIRSELGVIAFFRLLLLLLRLQPDILAFNTPRPILLGSFASRFTSVRARIIFRRVNFQLRKNFMTRIKYSWGVDCIVAISESIQFQLHADGVPACLIRTVHEGLDLTLYPKRTASRIRPAGEPVVIGTVAHLSPEKGLSNLVEAASFIADAGSRMRFVVVGDGECRPALEREVQNRGLCEFFHFAGFQDHPARCMEAFDIFVLPSLSEGLSSAILTAMALSLPVIATDVGGIPELICHEENGLLVPPGDSAALSEAIERLSNNPDECFRMGQKGRLRVEERFTLERKITKTEELCYSLLGETAPVSPAAHA